MSEETPEEAYRLTPEGADVAREIHQLWLAGFELEEIAKAVNLNELEVRVLYTVANYTGALD